MDNWYDIGENEIEEENSIKEYDITSTPNDYNIATLFNLIDNGVIRMPPFQRNYVWDMKQCHDAGVKSPTTELENLIFTVNTDNPPFCEL